MTHMISCRTGVFGSVETAFINFPKAGVYHAEVPPPAGDDYAALATLAREHGMTIATIATQLNLETDETAAAFGAIINGAGGIGVRKIFVSAKTGADTPWETSVSRLRAVASEAQAKGVTICMETHPPLGANAEAALKTLSAVDHPGLRYNFDTGNVYYYNEGTDTTTELAKVANWVASVHLKDTDGGFKSPHFPPLGQGAVDFPGVFKILDAVGFAGPYTLEIEGADVSGLDAAGRLEFLRESVDYLRRITIIG